MDTKDFKTTLTLKKKSAIKRVQKTLEMHDNMYYVSVHKKGW
jgi:hypothetical protein